MESNNLNNLVDLYGVVFIKKDTSLSAILTLENIKKIKKAYYRQEIETLSKIKFFIKSFEFKNNMINIEIEELKYNFKKDKNTYKLNRKRKRA